MHNEHNILQNELVPSLVVLLLDQFGSPFDPGASDIIVSIHNAVTGALIVDEQPCETYSGNVNPALSLPFQPINNPVTLVRYNWQLHDTDTPGVYNARFTVTTADGPESFPNDGSFVRVNINPA